MRAGPDGQLLVKIVVKSACAQKEHANGVQMRVVFLWSLGGQTSGHHLGGLHTCVRAHTRTRAQAHKNTQEHAAHKTATTAAGGFEQARIGPHRWVERTHKLHEHAHTTSLAPQELKCGCSTRAATTARGPGTPAVQGTCGQSAASTSSLSHTHRHAHGRLCARVPHLPSATRKSARARGPSRPAEHGARGWTSPAVHGATPSPRQPCFPSCSPPAGSGSSAPAAPRPAVTAPTPAPPRGAAPWRCRSRGFCPPAAAPRCSGRRSRVGCAGRRPRLLTVLRSSESYQRALSSCWGCKSESLLGGVWLACCW